MAHTHEGVEHHRTVGREVDHLVVEKVVGGWAGSSEKAHKVALQNGGSTKVGVERD